MYVGFAEINKSDICICGEQRRVIMPTPSDPLWNRPENHLTQLVSQFKQKQVHILHFKEPYTTLLRLTFHDF